MATDPRNLRPIELCRLLNSTPLGEVINERQLYRHRTRAGLRIGDAKRLDLLRYIAWLIEIRHAPKPECKTYEQLKQETRARNVALAIAGRDIGELPDVVDPKRKKKAATDFKFFCQTYFPLTFHLAWSPDHLKVIDKIEQAVLRGGLFSMAMPRGSGKTTICECACIWAVLNGHRKFVCLIGSDEGHAMDMLESIKTELDNNELLLEDYPEVVFPIQSLDGIANRCNGQLHKEHRTHISWTARDIVLPTIPGSVASGSIIKTAGITGRIRGMKYKLADGSTIRPTLVVIDDPQTDESARSLSQCATREGILAGAILGLAGPGKKISGIMPCTVIHPGDMADKILDRKKHPEWQGERTKLLYEFPRRIDLWEKYAEIKRESLINDGDGSSATAFYKKNRKSMDEGAVVAWKARKEPGELSAVQNCMNLFLRNRQAFLAEYQNTPEDTTESEQDLTLDVMDVIRKIHPEKRTKIPIDATRLTAAIDVQRKLLFYTVVAWTDRFTGYVVDYGTWPDQKRQYYSLADARVSMQMKLPGSGFEAFLHNGLVNLFSELSERHWQRTDGVEMTIDRTLVDARWGDSTEIVKKFCGQFARSGVMPAFGQYIGASTKPLNDSPKKPGERIGHHWKVPRPNRGEVRYVTWDSNHWKTFLVQRLLVEFRDPGSLSFFKTDSAGHQMIAEHICAEFPIKTEGRGREVIEWKLRPGRDNHFLDCLAMASVAASVEGTTLGNELQASQQGRNRRRIKLSQLPGRQ